MNGIRTRWSNHSWDLFSIGLDVAFPCDGFMGSNLMVETFHPKGLWDLLSSLPLSNPGGFAEHDGCCQFHERDHHNILGEHQKHFENS